MQNFPDKTFIKSKFDRIVKNYDLVNLLGSLGQDLRWRKKLVKSLPPLKSPILDLCCGPFTLTQEIRKSQKNIPIFALDISLEMLLYGKSKRKISNLYPVCGDAESLPFKDNSFEAITIVFGFRNLPHKQKALYEFYRVLKTNGILLILEFSKPTLPIFKTIYKYYLNYFMPFLGKILTGDKEAYIYLAKSINNFPSCNEVAKMLKKAGFKNISFKHLTFKIVTIYKAYKID